MYPIDVQGRKLLAAERVELLGADAKPTLRPGRRLRRQLGRFVIAAGLRLAPQGLNPGDSRATSQARAASETEDQAKGVIDCAKLARVEVSG